jgi:Flp pilus assembly protein TadB
MSKPDWLIELFLAVTLIIIGLQWVCGENSTGEALILIIVIFVFAFVLRSCQFYSLKKIEEKPRR